MTRLLLISLQTECHKKCNYLHIFVETTSGILKLNKSKSEPVDILVEAVEDYEEDVPDKEEVPIKCVSTVMNYQINCGIQFVDFDGRTWRHEADCITEAAENDLGEALRSPK